MPKLFIEDLDLKDKRVLIRVDFNVPLDDDKRITDDTRIRAALPTIRYVASRGGKAILMSHLGRPDGKRDEAFSLAPVASRLSELLGKPVAFAEDCVGEKAASAVARLKGGDVLLLENLRFYPGEEAGDEAFARSLASLGDVYIDDAFGTAHRPHASMVGVTKFLPLAAGGYLLKKEIDYLGQAVENPSRPFIAILGGAKVSDKIKVIKNLLDRVDELLIGGAMAYTFLKAQGISVGSSKVEGVITDKKGRQIDVPALVKEILGKAAAKKATILLPLDHVAAERFAADAATRIVPRDGIPEKWIGMDIGPKTAEAFSREIAKAKTVLWNGPMGVFEMKPFAAGTMAVARALADSRAVTIVGGGDSVAAVNQSGVADKITHISTGGGASLEFLEGKVLPGIAALTDKT
ncbi:MAG: phosphoglycerate kinase [Candidatus Aureabacteria bacterium]|nr:phosphoglycerate kinase [Candidatus Auribacterota bacterium]